MSSPSPDDVLVIGAGPAGLAMSACLKREGVAHVVLERELDAGAVWMRHYDRLHLHTTKACSALPMTPWPRESPRYPSRDEVVAYLRRYAVTHDIRPRFGVEVRSVGHDGERFVVRTDGATLVPRTVVVATGRNRVPLQPGILGLASFEGTVVHAGAYRNPTPFVGRKVMVVGCGNSGAEIALDLAEQGVDVAMVVRGPVHIVPRDLFGRPTQHTNIMLQRLPPGLRDAIAVAAVRLALGDLSRWGIVRPAMGPNRMIAATGRIPVLDVGTVRMIKRGLISVVPGIAEVTAREVRFIDGATRAVDDIVLATGYDTGLRRLLACSSTTRGLHFIGFGAPATGALRQIALEAEQIARSIKSAKSFD